MWKSITVTALVILILLIIPVSATASGGFAVGPPHIEVKVPANGNGSALVYITSQVDGQLVIGTEGIPFLVEPSTVKISSTDEYREIELRFYGNGTVKAGQYSGHITFLLYTSNTLAYGVKINADVTQIGLGGVAEHMSEYILGGIIGAAFIAGFLFFLLMLSMRSRTRKGIAYDSKFLIVPPPKASTKEEGKDVFYIVSQGRIIRVTPHEDDAAKSADSS
jgi:hypothetical protein